LQKTSGTEARATGRVSATRAPMGRGGKHLRGRRSTPPRSVPSPTLNVFILFSAHTLRAQSLGHGLLFNPMAANDCTGALEVEARARLLAPPYAIFPSESQTAPVSALPARSLALFSSQKALQSLSSRVCRDSLFVRLGAATLSISHRRHYRFARLPSRNESEGGQGESSWSWKPRSQSQRCWQVGIA
jgi:hypothetical protein